MFKTIHPMRLPSAQILGVIIGIVAGQIIRTNGPLWILVLLSVAFGLLLFEIVHPKLPR